MDFLSNMDYGKQINLLHSLAIGPLLVWTGYQLSSGKSVANVLRLALLIGGVGAILFHGYKSMQHQKEGHSLMTTYGYQVNALHFFFIGPLVAWVGYKLHQGKRVTELEHTTMLLLGAAAMLYHGYNVYKKL
jgi:hypothetical protein